MESVIVFIDGPVPTEEDLTLFEKVKANQFVNTQLHGDAVIKHSWATAVDPDLVPKGYVTKKPKPTDEVKAPVINPTAPFQAPKEGSIGIQADNPPPVATATPALPFPGVKAD